MATDSIQTFGQIDSTEISPTIQANMLHQETLANKPATDEQLASIWPAWNELPADLSPIEKADILILTDRPTVHDHQGHQDHARKLRLRHPHLPFDCYEYNQALKLACRWSSLVNYAKNTFDNHLPLVESQLDYPVFNQVVTGRVAIYRAVRELGLTQPDLLKCQKPMLRQIQTLERRYAAYLQAREDTIGLLRPLVFLPSLESERELPYEERALGLPNPPENFPQHIYIARLAGFGKCTLKSLAAFFSDQFLKLSRAQMDEFCNEFHRPTEGRQSRYLFLAAWMADNAPVFNAFKLTWADILNAARSRFNPQSPLDFRECPDNPDNLKEFWKDHENRLWPGQPRRIQPPNGRPAANRQREIPYGLLTPLPFVCRKG